MIRRLRWKFIAINMSIAAITLGIILGVVYHFTKVNIEEKSINMMQDIALQPFRPDVPKEAGGEVRLPYFVLQIDSHGELETTGGGYYDLSDEAFLRELIKTVFDSKKSLGMIEEYNLRFYHVNTPGHQRIVFADVSVELAALGGLMKNCFLIGAATFFVFLWISMLLARWAVKPVDTAWKRQRQFVADASHELKTPLTVIMTNAELLQSPEYDEESRRRFATGILAMTRQMKGLTGQMLELARTDNIQSEDVFRPVDLSKLISDAILPFEPVFFEKGLSLEVQIDGNIHVNGIETGLRQLPEILMDNAGKYSRAGGLVKVTLKRQGKQRCLLSVANEGEEIAPEELKNIFERFYCTDKARSKTGSFGLGLSIAKNIVMQHRGKIWAESKNGVNCFYVRLPGIVIEKLYTL